MKTLAELREKVLLAAADDDAEMITLANDAINQAAIIGAVIFDPPELQITRTYNLPIGDNSISLSAPPFYGKVLTLRSIYNTTSGRKLWYIPPDRWDIVVPTLTYIQYYTLDGQIVYLNDTETTTQIITLRTTDYPNKLEEDVDELQYDHHDEFVVSTATGLVYAAMEEKDTVDMWSTIQGGVITAMGAGMAKRLALVNPRIVKKE